MTAHHLRHGAAALTLVLLAFGGATGCAAFPFGSDASSSSSAPGIPADQPGDDGQSAADACALVQDTIEQAATEFESIDPQDPGAIVEGMRTAAENIADAAADVTNDEVAAVLPDLQAMFVQVGDVMAAIVAGDASKVTELSELGEGFQETVQRFDEACAA